MLKETEEKHKIDENVRIKLVPKSGIKLINVLERKDPFITKCKDNECPPCDSLEMNSVKTSKCRLNNITYEAKCDNCDQEGKRRVYTGESSRNLSLRSKEHLDALKRKDKKQLDEKTCDQ